MESMTPNIAPEKGVASPENVLPGSCAWRRYFARAVDTTVIMSIIFFSWCS
jgi:hypothetical protein